MRRELLQTLKFRRSQKCNCYQIWLLTKTFGNIEKYCKVYRWLWGAYSIETIEYMRNIFNILFKTVQYWNDRVCGIRMTWPSTIIDYHRQQSEGRICFTSNGQYWSTNIEAQRALLSWANSIKFSDQQISLNNSKVWKEKQNFEQFGPKSGFARLSRQEHTHESPSDARWLFASFTKGALFILMRIERLKGRRWQLFEWLRALPIWWIDRVADRSLWGAARSLRGPTSSPKRNRSRGTTSGTRGCVPAKLLFSE